MHSQAKSKQKLFLRRAKRTRKRVRGDSIRPRLTVFKSNEHLYAQLIDDTIGETIAGISTLTKDAKAANLGSKCEQAAAFLGKEIAKRAKDKQIDRVVFDRGPYPYHGLIAALADAARAEGLAF